MKKTVIFCFALLATLNLGASFNLSGRDKSGGAIFLNNSPWYVQVKLDRKDVPDTHFLLEAGEAYYYDSKIDIQSIHIIAYEDGKQEAIADAISIYQELNIKYMGTVNIITFLKGSTGLIWHHLGPNGQDDKAKMPSNTKFPVQGVVLN